MKQLIHIAAVNSAPRWHAPRHRLDAKCLLAFILGLLACCGCASSRGQIHTPVDAEGRIASHVRFLSQPGLKGRKPGSAGSRAARKYIESRFREYGLVPWGDRKNYEWSFGYGKNVVGFLPGTDPKLAGEIVLVSAHYDHLGKNRQGQICPGAADNASGVGALLEVARQVSQLQNRTKRPILFVSFDCEEMMLFGSFSFTCQKEVQSAKIIAVINVDMLGRDLLDVVRHTVFVAGSERFPAIGEQIQAAGLHDGIRVLPLGTDLIGPRGDHVAFESLQAPCLFFSCGTFRDYHEPGDTSDKLNYEDLWRSALVIGDIVRFLANSSTPETAAAPDASFGAELRSICTVTEEVNKNRVQSGIREQDAQAFEALTRQAQELSAKDQYDRRARQKLILNAAGILAPYFVPMDMFKNEQGPEQQTELPLLLQYMQEFYLEYGPQITEGYRRLVEQVLKYRPGLLRGMPQFYFEVYDIPDDAISIKEIGADHLALNALANGLTLQIQVKSSKWLINKPTGYLGSSLDPFDCEGTREQIADYCLLRLREMKKYPKRFATVRKVFDAITQTQSSGSYDDLLAARLKRGHLRDETDWIVRCLNSDSDSLILEALDSSEGNRDARIADAVRELMVNPKLRADIRARAIRLIPSLRNDRACYLLTDLLGDGTPVYRPEFLAMTLSDYPFADRAVVRESLVIFKRELKRHPAKSLGESAKDELRKLTRKDFGNDAAAWRQWLRKNPVKFLS